MITVQDIAVANGAKQEDGYVSLAAHLDTNTPVLVGCKVDNCRKSLQSKDAILVRGGWVCQKCFVTNNLIGFETMEEYVQYINTKAD